MRGEGRTDQKPLGRSTWSGRRLPRTRVQSAFPSVEMSSAAGDVEVAEPAVHGSPGQRGELQGVYVISVAARLLNMHPQTLRKYERMGFIAPSRSMGMLRLYSNGDIARLRVIKHLVENVGLNLAGVEMILSLVERLLDVRRQFSALDPWGEVPSIMSQLQAALEEILAMVNAGRFNNMETGPEGTEG